MNTVKIITNTGQQIDYYNVSDLNIRLNRIVEELNDLEIRFGEFSYQFRLPKTANNKKIFLHADDSLVINKFERNSFEVNVYLNSGVLFKGVLSLLSVDEENYNCVLLSRISLLLDELGEKVMKEIKSLPDIDFDYEVTIRQHIEANHQNSDEALYQFPLIYYSTFFAPPAVLSGQTDVWGYQFIQDRKMQNYYYILNNTNSSNWIFFHQIPLAYYIKPVLEAILEDAGWTLSGTFFEKEEIKRIILPYIGDNDIYDNSVYCDDDSEVLIDGSCSGANLKLKTTNFLPEITQLEFIQNLIKMFNLYFEIDSEQKIISFETYNDLFLNKTNPFILDNKIFEDTVRYEKVENNNPTVRLEAPENNKLFGDNNIFKTSSLNALSAPTKKLIEDINIYDYIGEDNDPIEIEFGQPVIGRKALRNKENYDNTKGTGIDSLIFIPQLTKQTLKDNNNMPFYLKDTDTVVNNEEDRIRHDGLPTLYYYYGISDCNFEQQSGLGDASDWFYINFHGVKMRIPFSSPYAYTSQRHRINQVLDTSTDDYQKAYASGMQSIYMMMGSGYTTQLDYSLVMSEMGEVYPTLYNQFYEERFRRYSEGYFIDAELRMNVQDWNNLKMHVPILYKNHIYSLLSIMDYDIMTDTARIRMIRH